jgi:phospholipid/cholesterol/gamma-HCH transport system substrate-binding protein
MYKTSTEIKVGLFVLAGLAAVAWMTYRLGGFRGYGEDFYQINAVFAQVSGLKTGVAVEVAGINVGRVGEIALWDEDRAKVTMFIHRDVRLPADSRAVIKAQGVLGDKYVELVPGTRGQPELQSGSSIEHTSAPPDMTDLMTKLSSVADDLKSLTEALSADGGGQELRQIVDNVKQMSQTLNNLLEVNGPEFTETMANMARVSQNLDRITSKLDQGGGSLGQLLNDDSVVTELRASLAGLRQITQKINSGEGTLGRLVNDDAAMEKIEDVLDSVNTYLEKGESVQVSLDMRADWMTRYNYLKGTVGLRIHTSPDRYYLLGVTGDYFGRYSRTDYSSEGRSWSRENRERGRLKVNAQIAQRFYDAVIRGGVFESGAGLGLDWYFLDDNLWATFEAFSGDFDHNPHLRALLSWRFWRYFYISGGYDDFASDEGRSSPFFGLGFTFNDDDLKYLINGATSFISGK